MTASTWAGTVGSPLYHQVTKLRYKEYMLFALNEVIASAGSHAPLAITIVSLHKQNMYSDAYDIVRQRSLRSRTRTRLSSSSLPLSTSRCVLTTSLAGGRYSGQTCAPGSPTSLRRPRSRRWHSTFLVRASYLASSQTARRPPSRLNCHTRSMVETTSRPRLLSAASGSLMAGCEGLGNCCPQRCR